MLVPSHRHTTADLEHWARLSQYDDLLSRDPHLPHLEGRAVAAIHQWAHAGPGIASTSWGKDSTVVAHLVAISDAPTVLVWVRSPPFDMPGCEQVRDAFLTQHPHVRYEERAVHPCNPKRDEPGHEHHASQPHRTKQDALAEAITERHINGTRTAESTARAVSVARRGIITRNTCRPIARWTTEQVFAYLHGRDLPVHPAYAMTHGGQLDRRWLRVHPLCSTPPDLSAIYRADHAEWEDAYFGDTITEARAQRATP